MLCAYCQSLGVCNNYCSGVKNNNFYISVLDKKSNIMDRQEFFQDILSEVIYDACHNSSRMVVKNILQEILEFKFEVCTLMETRIHFPPLILMAVDPF